MKLLYFIPSLNNPGGMERVLFLKLNYLVEILDCQVTIVTTENEIYESAFFTLNPSIEIIRLNLDFSQHVNSNLLIKTVRHINKLSKYKTLVDELLTTYDPDICVSLLGKEVAFLHKLHTKSKKVAEIHFSKYNRKQFLLSRKNNLFNALLGDFRTWQLERDISRFDHLVVLTHHDLLTWNIKNISCIPNINPLNIEESNQISCLSRKKRAIAVGRLVPQKGFDMVIKMWSLLCKDIKDWELVIIGDGYLFDELNSQIKALNLEDQVKILPPTKQIEKEYLQSSLYLMTSRYEGLPMVLIEAMACGLPCVSFDCECGPRDVISDGVDGFLIQPEDLNLFSEKVKMLIHNDKMRFQFSQNAFKKSENFSKNKIMEKWQSLFVNLLSNENPPN